MNKSSALCWSSDTYNPCPGVMETVPAARDYERGFKASLMVKDLRLAIENTKPCGANMQFGEKSLGLYEALLEKYSEKDSGYVYQAIHAVRVKQS